jgi:hypothetical protein
VQFFSKNGCGRGTAEDEEDGRVRRVSVGERADGRKQREKGETTNRARNTIHNKKITHERHALRTPHTFNTASHSNRPLRVVPYKATSGWSS